MNLMAKNNQIFHTTSTRLPLTQTALHRLRRSTFQLADTFNVYLFQQKLVLKNQIHFVNLRIINE